MVDTLTHIVNMISRMPEPHRGQPIKGSFYAAIANELDFLERVQLEIDLTRDLDSANYDQLKILARVLGETSVYPRDDIEIYRQIVKGRAFANASKGESLDVGQLAAAFFGIDVEIYRLPPKHVRILVDESRYDTRLAPLVGLLEDCADPSTSVTIAYNNSENTPEMLLFGIGVVNG